MPRHPAANLDPFSLVYDALWKMVERNYELKDHIPPGNRIKYKNDSLPKEENVESDTPELTLLLTGGLSDLMSTCSTTKVVKTYAWALATGDLENSRFHHLEFELFRCMVDFETTLMPLRWKDCQFVINLVFTGAEIGTLMTEMTKNVEGWSALLSFEVHMEFQTQLLRLEPLL